MRLNLNNGSSIQEKVLDNPNAAGEKSKIFILLSSTQFENIDEALETLKAMKYPINFRQKKTELGVSVKIECEIYPGLIFGYAPPDNENDLSQILSLLEQYGINVNLVK